MAAARTATRRSPASASAVAETAPADEQDDAKTAEKKPARTRKTAAKAPAKAAPKGAKAKTATKGDPDAEPTGDGEPDSPDLADLEEVEVDVVDESVTEEEPEETKDPKAEGGSDFVWDEEESEALRLARKRLACAATDDLDSSPQVLAYRIGTECAVDRLLLAGKPELAAEIGEWKPPRLPVSGGALIRRGLPEGPIVARSLKAIEQRWLEEGFPSGDRLDRIVDEVLSNPPA